MAKRVWQRGHLASRSVAFGGSTACGPSQRGDGRRRSRISKNVRQSGLVELVSLRKQGLVHSRARSVYSGSSLTSGNRRAGVRIHAPVDATAETMPCRHHRMGVACRSSIRAGSARPALLDQKLRDHKVANPNPRGRLVSTTGEMSRFLHSWVSVYNYLVNDWLRLLRSQGSERRRSLLGARSLVLRINDAAARSLTPLRELGGGGFLWWWVQSDCGSRRRRSSKRPSYS